MSKLLQNEDAKVLIQTIVAWYLLSNEGLTWKYINLAKWLKTLLGRQLHYQTASFISWVYCLLLI
jgi:hypothetical protein